MRRRLREVLTLALVAGAGLSCDVTTAPPTTGALAVTLQRTSSLSVDAMRVTVSGPITRTRLVPASGGVVTLDELPPGQYAVSVEGLFGAQVGQFGELAGITVRVGATAAAAIPLALFQPVPDVRSPTDTIGVLRFPVVFSAVPHATSYVVEWGTSPTLADAQSLGVTATSTEVPVAMDGTYYYRVRAVNAAVGAAGLPSPVRTVQVFQLVATVTVTPSAPTVTAGATQQFTFEARDADNVVVPNPAVLWVSNNHAVATISATGLATTLTSGAATISAVAKGTPGTAALTVNPLPPTKLVFTTPPANATAGAVLASVQVAIQNAQNQTATLDNTTQITVAFGTNAGGGILGGTKTVTVVNGVASFTTLTVDKSGTGYTLSATSGSLTSATSGSFNIVAGSATALVFSTQPTTTLAGAAISPAVQVEVRDGQGNRVLGSTTQVTLAIGANPASGVLSGTKVANAINGVASFSGLSIDNNGTGYTLTANGGGLPAATSAAFNIGGATQLAFVVQPSSGVAGAALPGSIQVEIRDASGNRLTTARDQVTLAFGANPGSGTLSGTKVANAVAGVATFTGISVDKASAGYTLSASAAGLTAATSSAFTISAATANRLVFLVQPSTVTTDELVVTTVRAEDAFGNLAAVTTDITVAIVANPGSGSLSGTTTIPVTDGIAAFTDLAIDKVGSGYTLRGTASGLTSATSVPFNVNVGAPAFLTFASEPQQAEPKSVLSPFAVTVVDAHGNPTTAELTVDLTLAANPGNATLTGTTSVLSTGGVATFDNVTIDSAATGYVLKATAASFGEVNSVSFDVIIEFKQMAGGDLSSCGLTTLGNAYCWGFGNVGAVGDETQIAKNNPIRVHGGETFSVLSMGDAHVCGLRAADSTAYCWGWNFFGQGGTGATGGTAGGFGNWAPTAVIGGHTFWAISAGTQHTCALRASDSTAFCWGTQEFGRLGNNAAAPASITTPTAVAGGHQFIRISAGASHTCAIRIDLVAMCWGRQLEGATGNGAIVDGSVVVPTAVLGGLTFLEISAGTSHTCALRAPATDRRGYCWGLNGSGQLGIAVGASQGSPVEVSNGIRYRSIDAGGSYSCGLSAAGTPFCWGSHTNGGLGNGQTAGGPTAAPAAVLGGLNLVSLGMGPGTTNGRRVTCGLSSSGFAYCWGGNNDGQVGDGTNFVRSVPVRVRGQRP